MLRIQRDEPGLASQECSAGFRTNSEWPSEARRGDNVSHRCAQQHSWEAKEAESVADGETGFLHGIGIVNG